MLHRLSADEVTARLFATRKTHIEVHQRFISSRTTIKTFRAVAKFLTFIFLQTFHVGHSRVITQNVRAVQRISICSLVRSDPVPWKWWPI